MQGLPALGIDVGGGSAKIGLVAPDGAVLARRQVASDPALGGGALLDSYLDAAFALQAEIKVAELAGIGIGLPGQIDAAGGTTHLGNVASLNGFPIVDYVRTRTGMIAALENDATLAALAEHRHGAGRGSRRFLTVTLGTGIGVGFIENGNAVHTSNGTLGDIGHVIVDPSGERACRQGCHGCLESVASALALGERFRRLLGAGPGSDDIAPLFARAVQGDAECLQIVDEAARFIAAGIVTWTHIFAPDRIAIAGGVSAAGPVFRDRIVAAVRQLMMPAYLANLAFVAAEFGNDAGLVGAAAYGRRQHSSEQVVA
jgi:glucokinase